MIFIGAQAYPNCLFQFVIYNIFKNLRMEDGRTNLFYLPKYFKKVEGERKGGQKRGRKRY
jgi:hypothetical protein